MRAIDKNTIKKIGSLPLGFDSKDVVYIEDNKILIAKPVKKTKVKKK